MKLIYFSECKLRRPLLFSQSPKHVNSKRLTTGIGGMIQEILKLPLFVVRLPQINLLLFLLIQTI